MFHIRRTSLLVALTGVSLYSLMGLSSRADDILSKAGLEFREHRYSESLDLARKSAEAPQRTFLMGVNALRLGKADEALPLLAEAEQKLPLLGDYAALYQAEALLKVGRGGEAAAKAAAIPKAYPASQLLRRAEKLQFDGLMAARDFKSALRGGQLFIEKYPAGNDAVEVLFQTARCREELDDRGGALQTYRSIWLNNPASSQAKKAQERIRELEKSGVPAPPYTAEELLRRASTLYSQNEFSQSLQTLQSIPQQGLNEESSARLALRSGLAQFRMRSYAAAEKSLARAAESSQATVRSEARFWRAKAVERQGQAERALGLYLELAGEGKKQEFAVDALLEAAGLQRGRGNYVEAARLFEQVLQGFPESRFSSRAAWDAAWCRYLSGEYAVAAESLKKLLKDEGVREKALYWLTRALENSGSPEAETYSRLLTEEYPAGFYATWRREQKGIKDQRESLAQVAPRPEPQLPGAFDKARLLASLGMLDEARSEAAAARKKIGDKKLPLTALAQFYRDLGDYNAAMALFQQSRPLKWERSTLPLWTAGYPLAYSEAVSRHTASHELDQALIYALIRAESAFVPAIKSPAGAIGLMQLMPATAKQTAGEKGEFDPARLTVPEYNIQLGTRHFRDLLKGHQGDVISSVAAYNAGAAAVARWRKNLKGLKQDEFIESIPYLETREYVKKVYASAATYRQLYGLK